jgi:hypothetical protein
MSKMPDYKNYPRQKLVFLATCLIGIISTFIPWAKAPVGFTHNLLTSGLHFFEGWLVFFSFLSAFIVYIYGLRLKFSERFVEKLPLWASIAAILFTVIFYFRADFPIVVGTYITFIISFFMLLITSNIIKFDK